jgi:SOS-response transcriptional repressor LexA
MLATEHMLAELKVQRVNEGLTELQERFLRLVDDYSKQNGRSPTRRELAKLGGQKSTHGVNQILAALEKKGYIGIDPPGEARNIIVRNVPAKQLTLPKINL